MIVKCYPLWLLKQIIRSLPTHEHRRVSKFKESLADHVFRDTLTFKAWKLFHVAFPDEFKDNFRVSILRQYGGIDKIDTIYRHISSLSSTTLTFLCITNMTLNSVNLNTDLLRFSNLGVLILQNESRRPFNYSEDRMIKNWGISVTSTKAFQKLRVLILTHFDISVHDTLDGLANFPALKLCRLEFACVPSSLLDALTKGSTWLHPKGSWRQRLTNVYVPNNKRMLQQLADTDKVTVKMTKILRWYLNASISPLI
jgi:hypothetical protein